MKGFGGVTLAQLSILTLLNHWLCLLYADYMRCVMSISHLWHKCTPWPTSPVCQWKWYRFGWNLSWKSVYLSEISPHSNPLPQTCRAYDNYLCIHIHSHSHTNIYHQPHCMRSLLVKRSKFYSLIKHYSMYRTYAAILKNCAVHRFKSWTPPNLEAL